jgi:hypothetical protein
MIRGAAASTRDDAIRVAWGLAIASTAASAQDGRRKSGPRHD